MFWYRTPAPWVFWAKPRLECRVNKCTPHLCLQAMQMWRKFLYSRFDMCFGPGTQGAGTKTHLKSRFCAILTKCTPHCVCRVPCVHNGTHCPYSGTCVAPKPPKPPAPPPGPKPKPTPKPPPPPPPPVSDLGVARACLCVTRGGSCAPSIPLTDHPNVFYVRRAGVPAELLGAIRCDGEGEYRPRSHQRGKPYPISNHLT